MRSDWNWTKNQGCRGRIISKEGGCGYGCCILACRIYWRAYPQLRSKSAKACWDVVMAEWGEKKVVVALVSNDDESLSALVIASVLALLLGIIFCYLIRRAYKSRLRKLVDMVRMRSGSK